jgi:hypothetical protein
MLKMTPRQKDLLDKVDLSLRPQSMKLRRLLMTENMNRTYEIEGANLNTSALTDTYTSIKRNIENRDRYESFTRIPSIKCGFSFAIDFSGSMNTFSKPTTWEMVLTASYALGRLTQTMGVESNMSIVGVDYQQASAYGSTDSYIPQAIMLKGEKEKWNDDLYNECWRFSPHTGTYVAQYIQVALDMVKRINAQKRVAFFLTDGADPGVYNYLQSFVDLAKAQGIHLVGIVFTDDQYLARQYTSRIEKNLIVVDDPKDLGVKMIATLEGLLKK